MRVDEGIGTSHGGRDTLWTSVWSLPIPSKIKIFLWRSLHELLPCMANLFYHKIVPNPICFRCTRKPETIIHALWCCSSTKEVWLLSPLSFLVGEYATTILYQQEMVIMSYLCWSIWHNRNEYCFHGTSMHA